MEGLGSDNSPICTITGIYGFPDDEDKYNTWGLIASLNNSMLPWLSFRDFNEILVQHDNKVGPQNHKLQLTIF